MSFHEILLIGALIVLALLPPEYDPAVKLKEWQMRNPHLKRRK